jgi:hypothetical protein
MPLFEIEFEGIVAARDGELMSAELLDGLADKLMEQLLELKEAIDPDIGATLSKGELRIRLHVEAEQPPEAYGKAYNLIESALRAVQLYRYSRPQPRWSPRQGHWFLDPYAWHIAPDRQSQDLVEA